MKKSLDCHQVQHDPNLTNKNKMHHRLTFFLLTLSISIAAYSGENNLGTRAGSGQNESHCVSALQDSPLVQANLVFSQSFISKTFSAIKANLPALAVSNPALRTYANMNRTQETLLTKFLAQVAGPEALFVGVKLIGNGILIEPEPVRAVFKVDSKSPRFHSLEIQFSSDIERATLTYDRDVRRVQIPVSEMLGMTQDTVHVLTRSLVSHPLHPQILTDEKEDIRKKLELPVKYPKDIQNQATQVIKNAINAGQQSLLIVGPPGLGKTKILDQAMKASLLNEAFRAYFAGDRTKPIFAIVAADSRLVWDQLFQQIAQQLPHRFGITVVTWGHGLNSHTPEQVAELLRKKQTVILISVTKSLVTKTKDAVIRKQFAESLNGFFFDEAHHLGAEQTWPLFIEFKAGPKKPFMFGMTATPIHSDKDIQFAFDGYTWWAYLDLLNQLKGKAARSLDDIVEQMRRARLIGDITPIERVFLLSAKSLDQRNPIGLPLFLPERETKLWEAKKSQPAEDLEESSITTREEVSALEQERQNLRMGSRRVFNPLLNRELIELLRPALLAHQGVLFVASTIPQANKFVEDLRESGFPAAAFHSKLPEQEKKWVDQRFKDKVVHCLVTVRAYDEGVDRSHLSMMIDLNPEIAAKNFWQRIGRLTRLDIGKQITYVSFISTSAAERKDQLALVEYLLSRKLHRLGDEYGQITWNSPQNHHGLSGLFLAPDGQSLSLNPEFNMAELQALKLLMQQETFWNEEKDAANPLAKTLDSEESEGRESGFWSSRRQSRRVVKKQPEEVVQGATPLTVIEPNPLREANQLLSEFKINTATIAETKHYPLWHPGVLFSGMFRSGSHYTERYPSRHVNSGISGTTSGQSRFEEVLDHGPELGMERVADQSSSASDGQTIDQKFSFLSKLVRLASVYLDPSIQSQLILDPMLARTLEIYFVAATFLPEIKTIPHWEHLRHLVESQFFTWATEWIENFEDLEIKIPSPTRGLGYRGDQIFSLTLGAEFLIVQMAMRPAFPIQSEWPLALQEYVLDSQLTYPSEAAQLIFNPLILEKGLLMPDSSPAAFAGKFEAAVKLKADSGKYSKLSQYGVPVSRHTPYAISEDKSATARTRSQRALTLFSRPRHDGSQALLKRAHTFRDKFISLHGPQAWTDYLNGRRHLLSLYTWIDHVLKPAPIEKDSKTVKANAKMTLHEAVTQLATEQISRTLTFEGRVVTYTHTFLDIFFKSYIESLPGHLLDKSFGKMKHMPQSLLEESYVYAGRIVLAGIEPFLNTLDPEVKEKVEVFLAILWLAPNDTSKSKPDRIKETIRRKIGAHFSKDFTKYVQNWWTTLKPEENPVLASTMAVIPLFAENLKIPVRYNTELVSLTMQLAVAWGPETLKKLFVEHSLRFLNTQPRTRYMILKDVSIPWGPIKPLQNLRNLVRTCIDDLEVKARGLGEPGNKIHSYRETDWLSGMEPNLPPEGTLTNSLLLLRKILMELKSSVVETQGIEAWKSLLHEDSQLTAIAYAITMGLGIQEGQNEFHLPDSLFQRLKTLGDRGQNRGH